MSRVLCYLLVSEFSFCKYSSCCAGGDYVLSVHVVPQVVFAPGESVKLFGSVLMEEEEEEGEEFESDDSSMEEDILRLSATHASVSLSDVLTILFDQ